MLRVLSVDSVFYFNGQEHQKGQKENGYNRQNWETTLEGDVFNVLAILGFIPSSRWRFLMAEFLRGWSLSCVNQSNFLLSSCNPYIQHKLVQIYNTLDNPSFHEKGIYMVGVFCRTMKKIIILKNYCFCKLVFQALYFLIYSIYHYSAAFGIYVFDPVNKIVGLHVLATHVHFGQLRTRSILWSQFLILSSQCIWQLMDIPVSGCWTFLVKLVVLVSEDKIKLVIINTVWSLIHLLKCWCIINML